MTQEVGRSRLPRVRRLAGSATVTALANAMTATATLVVVLRPVSYAIFQRQVTSRMTSGATR